MTARTKEQRMWDRLDDAAMCLLRLRRIENQLGKVPDVIGQNSKGVTFWLELKALYEWPSRGTTLPLKNAFEKGQIPFCREWGSWGGSAFVLLRVGRQEWLLLDATKTRPEDDIRTFTREELRDVALNAVFRDLDGAIEFLCSLEHKNP